MHCKGCGKRLDVGTLVEGKVYCERCYRVVVPAVAVVVKHWYTEDLFFPAGNKYLNLGLNFYEGCGFEIHRRVIHLNRQISPEVKEYIVLRYFGKCKCHLVGKYNWTSDTKDCNWKSCLPHTMRKNI